MVGGQIHERGMTSKNGPILHDVVAIRRYKLRVKKAIIDLRLCVSVPSDSDDHGDEHLGKVEVVFSKVSKCHNMTTRKKCNR